MIILFMWNSDVEARESIIYSYTKIFNAFAAKLSKAEASKLSRMCTSMLPSYYYGFQFEILIQFIVGGLVWMFRQGRSSFRVSKSVPQTPHNQVVGFYRAS